MYKIIKQSILFSFVLFVFRLEAGQIIVSEDFESGLLPSNWTILKESGNADWEYDAQGGIDNYPNSAYAGNYNVRFWTGGSGGQRTKLIMPSINLKSYKKPVLSFYHCQYNYIEPDKSDELKVFYQSHPDSVWKELLYYSTPINSWIKDSIVIDSAILSTTFKLAFEGISLGALGTCIDNILLSETGDANRAVAAVEFDKPDKSLIAQNTNRNIVARVKIIVSGNQGILALQTIKFRSLNTKDTDIKTSGVKLYSTSDTIFRNPTFIASTSFSSEIASFTGLTANLNSGTNTFWLTFDMASDAIQGDTIDVMLESEQMTVSGLKFPQTNLSSYGFRKVTTTIFFDDFEGAVSWVLPADSSFQINKPEGRGGGDLGGNPDPAGAYSGNRVLGNDLTTDGNYQPNLPENAVVAITPNLNMSLYKDVVLSFQQYINLDANATAAIDISVDGGSTWKRTTNSFNNDNDWKLRKFSLSAFDCDRKPNVKIRFVLGPTGIVGYSGWNIDDVLISGYRISNDVGIVAWTAPVDGCGKSASEDVIFQVKNFSDKISPSIIPLSFTLDGLYSYTDSITTPIDPGSTVSFPSKHKLDLSSEVLYPFASATTSLANDEYNSNNLLEKSINSLPTRVVPYFDGFENMANSYWFPGGKNKNWEIGVPNGNVLSSAYQGNNAIFAVGYPFNDSSFIESPCFDFTGTDKPIVDFYYSSELEQKSDGVCMQYTLDNGLNWSLLPSHSYNLGWNWYDDTLATTPEIPVWTYNSFSYRQAQQVLPDIIANKPSVRFRFLLMSNSSVGNDGFSFDNFSLYEAPAANELSSITSHYTACQNALPERISFTLKNSGIRTLKVGKDTIFAAFKVTKDGVPQPMVYDTILLTLDINIGNSATITFNKKASLVAGNYQLTVINFDKYPYLYPNTFKDTLVKSFTVYPIPVSGLPKSIRTAHPDTLILQANKVGGYTYLWSNTKTTDSIHVKQAGIHWCNISISVPALCSIKDTTNIELLKPDIGISKLISPYDTCAPYSNAYTKLILKNMGTDTIMQGHRVRLGFKFQTNPVVWDTLILNKTFAPGDTAFFKFKSNPVTLPTTTGPSSSYAYKVFCTLDKDTVLSKRGTKIFFPDSIPVNDTINHPLHIWGFPTVELGPNVTSSSLFYLLDAGIGYKTYLWPDNTTLQTYQARTRSFHKVLVTDIYNCPAVDSVFVNLVVHDIAAKAILSPTSDCDLPDLGKIKMYIQNTGTDTVFTTEDITIGYKYESNLWVETTFKPKALFKPGDTIQYQFANNESFNQVKDYIVSIKAIVAGDIQPANDELKDTISVFGYPPLNLGANVTVNALKYELDAGPVGNYSYLWNVADSVRSKLLVVDNNNHQTNNGNYIVTKTNSLFPICQSKDTVKVTLKITDLSIKSAYVPSDTCRGLFTKIPVQILQNGNINLLPTDTVFISYQVNSSDVVTKMRILGTTYTPGSIIYDTLKNFDIYLPIGTSKIKVFVRKTGDLRSSNDTITKTVVIKSRPIVDFGGVNDTLTVTYPYNLDAGYGSNYIYRWYDEIGSRYYSVELSDWFYARVTNASTGCFDDDTVYVNLRSPDVSISSVGGNDVYCNGDLKTIEVEMTNIGNITYAAGSQVGFVYQSNNLLEVDKIVTLTSNLEPGNVLKQTLSIGGLELGSNNLKFYNKTIEDAVHDNDTAYKVIEILDKPFVDIGSGVDTVISYGSIVLDATSSGSEYLWSDGSTNATLNVVNTAKFNVRVTNVSTLCKAYDTVYVIVYKPDIKINSINTVSAPCLTKSDSIAVEVENIGDIPFYYGEYIKLSILLNNTVSKMDSIMLLSDLNQGMIQKLYIKGIKNNFILGSNSIQAKIVTVHDINQANDTMSRTIAFNNIPIVNLASGQSSITIPLPHTIDAGAGNYRYQWNTGATSQSISVSTEGLYSVVITDNSSLCSGFDTLEVSRYIHNLSLENAQLPAEVCVGSKSASLNIKNNGIHPILKSDNITISYQIGSAEVKNQLINPENDIAAGSAAILNFNNIVFDQTSNNESVSFTIALEYGNTSSNTTASTTVVVKNAPVVNFGNQNDTIRANALPYILNPQTDASYSYLWNDNSTASTLSANNRGWFHVTVTDPATSCVDSDTVYLYYLFTDIAPINLPIGLSVCSNDFKTFSFDIQNNSSEAIPQNEQFTVGFVLNKQVFSETISLQSALNSGSSIKYNASNFASKMVVGSNSLSVFAKYTGDKDQMNDTLKKTFFMFENPRVNLGGKITYTPPRTLDAGAGYASYLWSNALSTRTIIVINPGWYWVTVTSNDGCIDTDSVEMIESGTSVEQSTQDAWQVYPNPVTNKLLQIVNKKWSKGEVNIRLYNIDGQLVKQIVTNAGNIGTVETMSIADIPAGMYHIRISDSAGKILYFEKIAVQ